VTPALAFMDVGEKFAAFLPRDALKKDPIHAALV
jgi:hypothetical protein